MSGEAKRPSGSDDKWPGVVAGATPAGSQQEFWPSAERDCACSACVHDGSIRSRVNARCSGVAMSRLCVHHTMRCRRCSLFFEQAAKAAGKKGLLLAPRARRHTNFKVNERVSRDWLTYFFLEMAGKAVIDTFTVDRHLKRSE